VRQQKWQIDGRCDDEAMDVLTEDERVLVGQTDECVRT